MEVSQEIYDTAQLHSCPKSWEKEEPLLTFAILISKQDKIQNIK